MVMRNIADPEHSLFKFAQKLHRISTLHIKHFIQANPDKASRFKELRLSPDRLFLAEYLRKDGEDKYGIGYSFFTCQEAINKYFNLPLEVDSTEEETFCNIFNVLKSADLESARSEK